VDQLWRYPVASVGGERVTSISVGPDGVEGDRRFLLVDLDTGELAAPEKLPRWRPALQLSARWADGNVVLESSEWSYAINHARLDDALTEFVGFRCGVRPSRSTLTASCGVIDVRPRYDVSALHLISTKTIGDLQDALPRSQIDVRRFRPNIVVAGDASENDWLGEALSIGTYVGPVSERTKRCGMTMIAQPGLPEDPDVLRTIVRGRSRVLGIYAGVMTSGSISVGDEVWVS